MPRGKKTDFGKFSFISYFDDINDQIQKGEKRNRSKAVRYIARKMKKEIEKEYGKGNLYKGVGYANYEDESRVGYHKPAQHAHLVELGTDQRFVKNWFRTGKRKAVGAMPKREILRPILRTEKAKVEEILSEPWVK